MTNTREEDKKEKKINVRRRKRRPSCRAVAVGGSCWAGRGPTPWKVLMGYRPINTFIFVQFLKLVKPIRTA